MALSNEFYKYIEHFGETVPMSVLHKFPKKKGCIALRHDVDHNIDIALEMAYHENKIGAKATYFLLPTAHYWHDDELIEKCLQLQDYGHEVGLHVNILAQWVSGETDDPEKTLNEQLNRLRNGGIHVTGIAAHGDRRCYEHNFSNYWCFNELRPNDPFLFESGRSAEGLVVGQPNYQLLYPKENNLVRFDSLNFPLWSISMRKFKLDYHAWHVPHDRYFSDSGGGWLRTANPLNYKLDNERWQVLMHPIHWRIQGRHYFFLSTARSGSFWLSEVLNRATPLKARHEYILNQDYHRGATTYKNTSYFKSLEENPKLVTKLFRDAWEEIDLIQDDYAEINVYLASFINELKNKFPEAIFIHLHRHPAQVIRSLMDRDWYDTPEDHTHPSLINCDIKKLSQFERVCKYVNQTNEILLMACDKRVGLEDLNKNIDSLKRRLEFLEIPFHARLGSKFVNKVLNSSSKRDFETPNQWTLDQKIAYDRLVGDVTKVMGYVPFHVQKKNLNKFFF